MSLEGDLYCPGCRPRSGGRAAYRGASEEAGKRPLLEAHRWEGDVEVRRCDRCGGVFVTAEQLRRIQDLRENRFDARDRFRALNHRGKPYEGEPRACPACRGELFAKTYKRTAIPLEVCLECGGMFLAEEALRDIEIVWETGTG
jgi:Zn-finger nucleic acid-binding protein